MESVSTATKRKTPDEQSPPKDSSKKRTKKLQVQCRATPEICVTCNKKAKSDAIVCEWCSKWEHRTCAGLSTNEYDMLTTSSDQIMFFCTMCYTKVSFALRVEDENTTKLQSVDNKLSEKINNLSQKITNIEAKLQDYHKSVLRNCDTAEEGVHNQSQGLSRSPIFDDSVVNITLSLTSEQKEKERRQFNVVLHNLKESDASDSVTRKQDDIDSCCSLFSTYLSVSASIKSAIRLGKRGSRPCRLLKLTLGSLDEKAKILKHKMKLKAEQNPEHVRKIYISPDLTPLEQRRNNALRKQLDEMNKIQNIYVIRKGQIVRKHGSNVSARTSMSPFVSESNDNGSRTAS